MKLTFLDPCDYNFYNNQQSGPIGLAYIASYLEKTLGKEVEVNIEVDPDTVLRGKPDIVGISAYTETFSKALRAAEKIKKNLNIPILIGGKHITALPENLSEHFDVGIIGDGEITTAELLMSYSENKKFLPEELVKIKNLAFRDNQQLIITPQREPLRTMDDLPPPKREILQAWFPSLNKVWKWPQGLYTSRGCPYKCPFCIHSKIKFVTRYHSPERVVSEINEIINKFPEQTNIIIHDDLFTISKKRLQEIVDLIVSEKINRKVSFTCMCKANLFDDDIAYLLKKMNVNIITFGFESGDEVTLQYLKKDSSKVEENIRAINACNKYGIHCGGYFILGSPPENVSRLQKTYWFIRQNYPPMSLISAFCLTPFPGTKTWDLAKERGLVDEKTENWENYNYLMYNANKGLLLNDHYDQVFFAEVYENYFQKLNEKNIIFSTNYKSERNYYSELFKHLNKYNLQESEKILEIGSYYQQGIETFWEQEKNIRRIDHWSWLKEGKNNLTDYFSDFAGKSINKEKFDLIFFNHSLEQILQPFEVLEIFSKKYLSNSGKLVILVKNPQFINYFVGLITNNWDYKISGFKKFDNFHLLNLNKLLGKLKELGFTKIDSLPIEENVSNYSDYYRLLNIFFKKEEVNDYLSKSNISGYLFIAEKN